MVKQRNRDHSKLKGKIREKNESYRSIADKMGITASTLSNKLNGHTVFDADEIHQLVRILDIEPEDIALYFFN